MVIETRPLVKRGELSPERGYKFQIGSVTRERKELEDGFPTQSKHLEWDNRGLEDEGGKHSEPLRGKQELVISDQIQKGKENKAKKKRRENNNQIK